MSEWIKELRRVWEIATMSWMAVAGGKSDCIDMVMCDHVGSGQGKQRLVL